jgi:hypothetical protein
MSAPAAHSRKGAEEKHRDVDVAVVDPDEVMRDALEGQVLLPNTIHIALL